MKRILIGILFFVACLFLRTGPASVANEKPQTNWQAVDDGFKVLRLWKVKEDGPRYPEIAVLQLSEKWEQSLESDPLGFLKKYNIFDKVDEVRGHVAMHLAHDNVKKPPTPYLTVVVHDLGTYAGFAAFEVAEFRFEPADSK
jgi:hypothetical protein